MSMTTDRQQHSTPAHETDREPYSLRVRAQVTIIDQSGTAVPTRSMATAIKTIRQRYHADVPLIALDRRHHSDPLFSTDVQAWLVTETMIMPLDGEPLEREPDYVLHYHEFTLDDPSDPSRRPTPCQAEALIPVAMKAADSTGSPVRLSSSLLGFTPHVLHPGDATQKHDADQEQNESVLDALDPGLFTADTPSPLVLVHPPAPRRDGNTITIYEATGVVYNAEPGEYPIDGQGVTVQAEPAEGYQFPENVTAQWDYEYDPAHAADQQTASHDLAELVEAEQVTLESDPNSDTESAATPNEDDTASAEPSNAVVLRSAAAPWWKRRVSPSLGFSALRRLLSRWWTTRPILVGTVAAIVVAAIAVLLFLAFRPGPGFAGSSTPDPATDEAGWISSFAPPASADGALNDDYSVSLWELGAGQAEELSWYSAGVAHIDPNDDALVLLSTLTGEETARVELEEPVEWTTEFLASDEPAVGARTESGFSVLTSDGETQTWNIDPEASLQVSGSTPMLTTSDGEVYALIVGEDDPVHIDDNPDYSPAAIDDGTLIQFAAGMPRLVTLPMDSDADAAQLRLDAPTDTATFSRHLAVGHGLALSEWQVDGQDYLVVHDLSEDATVTAAVPSIDDPQGWSLGRGMDLAIIGPYAFDLDTGELTAESPSGDFLSALGTAAIFQGEQGREFLIDSETFYEDSRVIGHTGRGTIIVRQPDGSAAALSETSGTA